MQHIEFFSRAESRVLDIFCGSGSVGLEALSRGAQHVTFVDLSQNCINTALGNAQSCGFSGKVEGVEARAESFLLSPDSYVSPKPYDLISLTPPYEEVSYDQLIDSLCSSNLMNENTILLIEYPVEMGSMPYILGQDKFFGLRNRRYGRTIVAMYVYRPSTKVDMRPEEFSLAQNNLD